MLTCCLMCSYSSAESFPALRSTLSSTPILPMSCSRPAKYSVLSVLASQPSSSASRTATRATRSLWPQVYGSLASMAEVSARTMPAKQLRLLPVQFDVAAVDAEDRGDRAEQTGLDGAELAALDVVHRGQPAEDVLAFGQRHDDHLADLRAGPVGLRGHRRG